MPSKGQSSLGKGLEHFFGKINEEEIFSKALGYDESGNYLYAFHYYMKLVELKGKKMVKALNNAAIILYEHGFRDEALQIIENALTEVDKLIASYEGYEDLIENLRIIRGEDL